MIKLLTDNPWIMLSVTCCLWPLLWAALGYVAGRFKPRFRNPISLERRDDPGAGESGF